MIGLMDKRVDVLAPTRATNAHGEAIPAWETKAARWAKIEPLSGAELWRAQQVQGEVTHRITVRFFKGLKADWRFRRGLRLFEITQVIDRDAKGEYHECLCVERV